MQKEYRKIEDLKLWDENPRTITSENFERLKNHVKKLGQYKPIIINQDNVVVGGNMRVLAMRDLKIKEVWVTVVTTKSRAEMLEYAMSDNENFGDWDEEKLAEMLSEEWTNITAKDFKLDFGKETLEELLEKFGPGEDDASEEVDENEEDKKDDGSVECPKCHTVFKP